MQLILPYKDISIEVKNDINTFTSDSTVALLGYDEKDQPMNGLIASGSLTEINSIYGVLTAKHVWEKFRKKAANISFCVLGKPHYIHEKIEYFRCYFPEDYVDICFIEIPPTILGTIKAIRNFHPIRSESFSELSDIKNRLWITVGFPYIMQSTKNRKINILRYYTHLTSHTKISEDWDIIELDIQTIDEPNELPKNFGGMSGGEIWSFEGFYNEVDGRRKFFIKKNPKDSLLAGVNFYQKISKGKVYKICGVGPISIYSGMTKLVSK